MSGVPHTRESDTLEVALAALKHVTVFISTREKMHSIGIAMHTAAIRQCEVSLSTPLTPSDEAGEVSVALHFLASESDGLRDSERRLIERASKLLSMAPATPSDEMVEAAWNEVWDEVSMGLSRDDMRRAIQAALNLMGGKK